ncbi:MAG: universal stress protein [Gemmatimonadaceae bacterium]
MDTLKIPTTRPEAGVRASHGAPIIVATDGHHQSDAALVVGQLLADSPDAIRLITVLQPVPVLPDAPSSVSVDIEASRRAEARRNALGQVERIWQNSSDVELHEGDPALVVSRVAHGAGATMIVAGLGRHRVSDRIFGSETVLRLIRVADRPVLAVANGTLHAPRRIVVAVDFSETSLRAARMSLELAASGATIYLAHVAPRDSSLYDWADGKSSYKQDAGGALGKVRDQLHVPKSMTMQSVLLQGDPATELLAFATSVNADLIATGSHGYGFVTRMLIGSVATRLVRCSTCSVLTVPRTAVMTGAGITVEPLSVVNLAHADWAAELDTFSRRNLGRRGTLEVDDPEIGAQAQEFDYPLMGATFDPHDQRVELMFGTPSNVTHHLTRSIGDVKAIDVLRDDRGRDLAIRIAHGNGQTLLTLAS